MHGHACWRVLNKSLFDTRFWMIIPPTRPGDPLVTMPVMSLSERLSLVRLGWMTWALVSVDVPAQKPLAASAEPLATCSINVNSSAWHPTWPVARQRSCSALRAKESRKHRAQFFGGTSSGQFPVVRESGTSFINIVGEYVHLGNTVHHTGGHGREMTRRLGIAHQAFTQHRRAIYANPALSLLRRRELFETLIVSKLLYSAETWVPRTLKEKDRLHAGIIRLYRRLCKLPHDAALRDDDVLCHGDFLTPTELLRRQRLRYLPTLYKCGDLVPWGLLSLDEDWIELLRSDFEWMYAQLCNASRIPDPSHDFQPWHDILVHHPRYWKRLLRRSCEHAILQRQKLYQVRKMHCDIVDELQRHGPLSAVMPPPQPQAVHEFFGCMHCGLACRSLGGEGAHMFRRHGERASHRRFCEGTQCLACLKEFHTLGRLSHHVRRSAACQTILQQRGFWSTQGEGEGSQLHAEQERVHNGLRLVQQAAGPNLPQPGGPAPPAVHQECLTLFAELLLDSRAEAFERRCRESVPEFIISWTMFRATLSHAWNAMTDDDWELAADRKDLYALCFQRLQDPRTWTIFQHQDPVVQAKHSHLDLYDMETWFLKLASQNSGPWTAHPKLERQPVRERIVLHLFSGRRRHGDLQEFMEKIAADQQDEMLFVVSIDIVVDSRFGDVRNSYTRQFWLSAIRAGYVLALLAGPPCNTWSAARAHQLLGDRRRHAPRVVRPADEMWGASSLSLRELRDVSVGNELLIFTLVAFIHLYITQGYAIVEHPAPPVMKLQRPFGDCPSWPSFLHSREWICIGFFKACSVQKAPNRQVFSLWTCHHSFQHSTAGDFVKIHQLQFQLVRLTPVSFVPPNSRSIHLHYVQP